MTLQRRVAQIAVALLCTTAVLPGAASADLGFGARFLKCDSCGGTVGVIYGGRALIDATSIPIYPGALKAVAVGVDGDGKQIQVGLIRSMGWSLIDGNGDLFACPCRRRLKTDPVLPAES